MVSFDFKTYNKVKINNADLSYIVDRFLNDNNMTGWYDLNTDTRVIKEYSKKIIDKADIFIVIGIGGSYLGAKGVIDALSPYFNKNKPEVLFVGNSLSSDYLVELIDYIKDKSVYINAISKSGNTLETTIVFDELLDYMKNCYTDYKERIIVTTNSSSGYLYDIATKENLDILDIPDNIVGRYSVLSNAGLLPISVAGIDIDKLISGAKESKTNLKDCYEYTLIRDKMYNDDICVESFDIYEPKLYYFTEWIKQLFAESQGKNGRGILPISTINTKDLHSFGQYYQDGSPIIFSTTIFVDSNNTKFISKYNKSLNDINLLALNSVVKAHYKNMNTNIITLDKLDEFNIGYLIFFFEMSAMMGSYLLEVNYFDQPGVTEYKDLINKEIMQ